MSDTSALIERLATVANVHFFYEEQWENEALTQAAALLTTQAAEITRLTAEKPSPNPEWEAKADAFHAETVAEVGVNPFDTLVMLEKWKADAEPANHLGQVSFSRAMLDSATDALRAALEMARTEHLEAKRLTERAERAREMIVRLLCSHEAEALALTLCDRVLPEDDQELYDQRGDAYADAAVAASNAERAAADFLEETK